MVCDMECYGVIHDVTVCDMGCYVVIYDVLAALLPFTATAPRRQIRCLHRGLEAPAVEAWLVHAREAVQQKG